MEGGDDHMDWIGSKLSLLIQEGQKALGREVVVASETQDDEVDDGTDAWVEEYSDVDCGSSSKRSRRRRARPENVFAPSHSRTGSGSGSASLTSSPRTNRFDHTYQQNAAAAAQPQPLPMAIPRPPVEGLTPSASFSGSVREDESQWLSPELRESMEKARARYLRS